MRQSFSEVAAFIDSLGTIKKSLIGKRLIHHENYHC